jgi:hypothetical protein
MNARGPGDLAENGTDLTFDPLPFQLDWALGKPPISDALRPVKLRSRASQVNNIRASTSAQSDLFINL